MDAQAPNIKNTLRNAEIKKMYCQIPTKQIAAMFNISVQRVKMIADPDGKIGREKRLQIVSLSQNDLEEMFSLFPKVKNVYEDVLSGLSISDIIAKYNFPTESSLVCFMSDYRAFGVPFPLRGSHECIFDDQKIIENGLAYIRKTKARLESLENSEARNRKICNDYFELHNVDEIAKRYNVKSNTVPTIAHSYNKKHDLGLSRDVTRLKKKRELLKNK